jgi:hypothetical protein
VIYNTVKNILPFGRILNNSKQPKCNETTRQVLKFKCSKTSTLFPSYAISSKLPNHQVVTKTMVSGIH